MLSIPYLLLLFFFLSVKNNTFGWCGKNGKRMEFSNFGRMFYFDKFIIINDRIGEAILKYSKRSIRRTLQNWFDF
jgi:hypothetical protein